MNELTQEQKEHCHLYSQMVFHLYTSEYIQLKFFVKRQLNLKNKRKFLRDYYRYYKGIESLQNIDVKKLMNDMSIITSEISELKNNIKRQEKIVKELKAIKNELWVDPYSRSEYIREFLDKNEIRMAYPHDVFTVTKFYVGNAKGELIKAYDVSLI